MLPNRQHKALIQYLQAKVIQQDWHGVSDVANDLRVLEAKFPELTDNRIVCIHTTHTPAAVIRETHVLKEDQLDG